MVCGKGGGGVRERVVVVGRWDVLLLFLLISTLHPIPLLHGTIRAICAIPVLLFPLEPSPHNHRLRVWVGLIAVHILAAAEARTGEHGVEPDVTNFFAFLFHVEQFQPRFLEDVQADVTLQKDPFVCWHRPT